MANSFIELFRESELFKNNQLGIPIIDTQYVFISQGQNLLKEIIKIDRFINDSLFIIHKELGEIVDIQFLNYGYTQLVLVITMMDETKYTLLVNQPSVEYGIGKREFNNLKRLSQRNPNLVVEPIIHIAKEQSNELYLTPYYYQSRCVGIETTDWGIWIPEPYYHFKPFSQEERRVINSSMVAALITMYDEENNQGLSKVRLDCGDFMLLKGYEEEELIQDSIYKNLKLIAARDSISINLEEYIERLRIELTNNISPKDLIILGKELQNPLTIEEIEKGIEYGLTLRNEKSMQIKF